MPKTLDGLIECWNEGGRFTHRGKVVSEDTRFKIAFSLWKENAVLVSPGVKDLTTQEDGPEKVTSGLPDNAFNKKDKIPF